MTAEYFVEPDFDLNGSDVKQFKPLVPSDLLMALFDASGIDADVAMQEGNEATVNVRGNT